MQVLRWMGGAAAVMAMAGMAVPAQAQRWHWPRHGHHHGDRFDVGDALVGGLIVGGIIALTSKKKPRPVEEVYDAPPPLEEQAPPPVDGPDAVDMDAPPPGSGPIMETPAPDSARFDGLYDEDAAADRCAMEAESVGERYARLARVSAVTSTVWNGASWVIKGNVELADSYRDEMKQTHKFRCALRRGRDPVVTIDGMPAL